MSKRAVVLFTTCALLLSAADHALAQTPAVPTPVEPANGASVQVPFTISWSATLDPTLVNGGYNWQVSRSATFSPLVTADSTSPAVTQDTVSGLPPATYFWRVQAVNGAGASAWSSAQSFTVTGAGPGTPGTPVLGPTQGYSTFHPWEVVRFNWSAVPDAVTYRLEVSNDPDFPMGNAPSGTTTFWNDNIPTNHDGYQHTMIGNWFARVFAVSADNPQEGIRSLPSNVIQFSAFYDNPIGPPPELLSPLGNPTLKLPVTLSWAHVPNPQPSGYVLEVANDPNFADIEWFFNQYTEPTQAMLSLSSGPKFWRVLSQHGLSSPTTNAVTDWSVTGQFTISSDPATPVSIGPLGGPPIMYSGATRTFAVQLTAELPSAATVSLSSSHPNLVPLPATLSMPGGGAYAELLIKVGQVTTPTVVTLTATLNGVSASSELTIRPPTLDDEFIHPTVRATGGTAMSNWVSLEGSGLAGPNGFVVNLSSSSPLATPPATVTIPAGVNGTGFQIQTSPVDTITTVTITASAGGVTTSWPITLTPSPAPSDFFIRPLATTNGSQGVVTATEGLGQDQTVRVTSSNPAVAAVPSTATLSAGSGTGFFNITTTAVSEATAVTIAVTGGGVTLSQVLTVYPTLPPLTSMSASPNTVVGGTPSTGTVTLGGPAPAVGVHITLGSNQPLSARVPRSVFIAGGATSATFPIETFATRATTVQLSAAMDGVFQFTSISVTESAPTGPLSAPTLVSPADRATVAQPITFDWSDVANAATYVIQIDTSSNFTTPLTYTASVSVSTATVSGLPARDLFWRVRAVSASGTNGPFSSTRRFTAQSATTPTTPTLSTLSVSPTSVVGGNNATGTATLTSAAPSGGLVVTIASSNAAAVVPASVTVAAGATSAQFGITTSSVTSSTSVTITAANGSVTRTATLTVNPPSSTPTTLPAPTLISPASDARFAPGSTITFDWSDVSGASSYSIQIADSETFSSPLVNQTTTTSQFSTSTLPERRMWWRVRAIDASGTPGAWSAIRRFEVKN
jgi:hypothetical protein